MMARVVAAAALALLPMTAAAQDAGIEFGSSPNPVGSGARALGIASAFIATADDATAASWNPSGLIALERPEASIVLSGKNRNESFSGVGIEGGTKVQRYTYADVNYFSVAYPFKIGTRFFVASLNYQTLIDFDKRVQRTFHTIGPDLRASTAVDYLQKGSMRSLAPALAFQLSPTLALGFTVNIWTNKLGYKNGWVQRESIKRSAMVLNYLRHSDLLLKEEYGFNGIGGNLGLLWDITPNWTFGAVVKTPTWGKLTRKVVKLEGSTLGQFKTPKSLKEAFRMPLSYGLGAAYRHSDATTLSFDANRTEWGLFRRVERDISDPSISEAVNPINSRPYGKAKVPGIIQVHIGGEHLFIFPQTVVPVRGGFFYDPEPADQTTNHFFGVALGTGVSISDFIIDLAYQYRFSLGAETDPVRVIEGSEGVTTTTAEGGAVWQHLLYLSTIYHF